MVGCVIWVSSGLKEREMKTIFRISVCIVMFFVALPVWADQAFTPEQRVRIHTLIGEYIQKNPKVIIDAVIAYRQAEMARRKQQVHGVIQKQFTVLANPDLPTYWGSKKPKILIIEFSDYQCAHCRQMAGTVRDIAQENPDVRVVVRELPVLGHHSLVASKVAMLAAQKGHYASFHHHMMDLPLPLNKKKILTVAHAHALSDQEVNNGLNGGALDRFVEVNYRLAEQLKLIGTPAFIVSDVAGKVFYFVPGVISKSALRDLVRKVSAESS
jgi:protein-disulfide isomerase